jgi:hypothetical protein
MSDSMVIEPTRRTDESTGKSRGHIGAWFTSLLESLVSAQRQRFEDSDPLLYRYPPL